MNLGALRTALQARGYETDTAAAQTEALNSVARRIYGDRRWDFLEVTDDVALTVGDETPDLSSITDIHSIDAVRIEFGSDRWSLEFIDADTIRERLHEDRDNGAPEFWSRHGRQLYIYPRPDKAYTLTLDYIKEPAPLVNDGDEPAIPDTYHDVLVVGAARDIAYRERDWSAHQAMSADFAARYAAMVQAHGVRQRQNTTHVKRSDFWDRYDRPAW